MCLALEMPVLQSNVDEIPDVARLQMPEVPADCTDRMGITTESR